MTKEKTLHSRCREFFEECFNHITGNAYYWTAKDAKNLKLLIGKLKFSWESKYNESPEDDDLFNSFKIILERLPGWFRLNAFDIPSINSNYNKIIQQIKNEKGEKYSNQARRLLENLSKDRG